IRDPNEIIQSRQALFALEIDHEAMFVAVVRNEEKRGVAKIYGRRGPGELAFRRLDLEDLSAEISQDHRRTRTRQRSREIDDAYALKRAHVSSDGSHRSSVLSDKESTHRPNPREPTHRAAAGLERDARLPLVFDTL